MAEYIERTEELILAVNAGARAIENTKRYHGVFYSMDVFSNNPKEISYLKAAKVLREFNELPAVDVAPVVHGRWYDVNFYEHDERAVATCSHCRVRGAVRTKRTEYGFWVINSPMCPNCGARMDGE